MVLSNSSVSLPPKKLPSGTTTATSPIFSILTAIGTSPRARLARIALDHVQALFGGRVARLQLQHFLKGSFRIRLVSRVEQGLTQPDPTLGILGVARRRPPQIGDGLRILRRGQVEVAPSPQRRGVLGIDLQGLVKGRLGLVVRTLLGEHVAVAGPGLERVRR